MAGKGQPKSGGRNKGGLNKVTMAVKEAILAAFNSKEVGGVEYLKKLALEKPEVFVRLLARLVPNEIHAEVSKETMLIVRNYTGIEWEEEARKRAAVIKDPRVGGNRLAQ